MNDGKDSFIYMVYGIITGLLIMILMSLWNIERILKELVK